MVKVLSFDVGIINLAYCIFNTETLKIEQWEIITIPQNKDYSKLYIELIKSLDSRQCMLNVHTVLIEKQPSFNPKMRIIAGCLQTYFFIRGVVDRKENPIQSVEFFSPKHKLKCYSGPELNVPGKSKYAQTKQKGVIIARSKLSEYSEPVEMVQFFESNKKKDDLADCYLQALTWCTFKKLINVLSTHQIVEKPKKYTKVMLRSEIKEIVESSTSIIVSMNELPVSLKNEITNHYSIPFPLDTDSLGVLFGKMSMKKILIKSK